MILMNAKRCNFACSMLAVCFLIATEVSPSGQIPSSWSQHFHDGKTYYYNQQTGITQWELPTDFQKLSEGSSGGDNYEYPNDDHYNGDNSKNDWNIPNDGQKLEKNVFDDPFLGVVKDPWDDVEVDDDDDFTRASGSNRIYSGNDGRNHNGPDDNSDDEDWHDDRFQQQTSRENIKGKKLSKVTKTISTFRTGFSALKTMLKQKTSGKKEDGYYGDMRIQKKDSQTGNSGDRNSQGDYLDDGFMKFDRQSRRHSSVSANNNRNDLIRDDYRDSNREGDNSNMEGGLRNRRSDIDHVQSPTKENSTHQRDEVYPDLSSSSSIDVNNRRADYKKVQQEHGLSEFNAGKDGNFDKVKENKFPVNQNYINKSREGGRDGEKSKNGFNDSNKNDKQKATDREISSYDRMDEEDSFRQKDTPAKKISVRSMGKFDETLWADYVDSEEKSVKKKSDEIFTDFKSSSTSAFRVPNLKNFSLFRFFKGASIFFSTFFRLISYSIPLTNRLAVSMLFVSLSAAPIGTILFLFLSFLKNLLLPLGLLYVTASVRSTVEGMKVSTSLFSGREYSSIIISPSSNSDHSEEDSSGTFQSDLSSETFLIDVADSIHPYPSKGDTNSPFGDRVADGMKSNSKVISPGGSVISATDIDNNVSGDIVGDVSTAAAFITPDLISGSNSADSSSGNNLDYAAIASDGSDLFDFSKESIPNEQFNFMKYTAADIKAAKELVSETVIPSISNSDFNAQKNNFPNVNDKSKNYGNLESEKITNFREDFISENSFRNFHEGLESKFQFFLGKNKIIEKIFKTFSEDLKNTYNEIFKYPNACAFLGVLFFSVILCGVIVPGIKQHVGEKIINYLNSRVKKNNEKKEKIGKINQKEKNDKKTNKLFSEDDEEDSNDDDDDDVHHDKSSYRNKFFLITKRAKNFFTFRHRKINKKIQINKNLQLNSEENKNFEISEESFLKNLLNNGNDGHLGGAIFQKRKSDKILLTPINLISSINDIYFSFFYSSFLSFIISLLKIENQLKYTMMSPYLFFCFLSIIESYSYQPSCNSLKEYNRFSTSDYLYQEGKGNKMINANDNSNSNKNININANHDMKKELLYYNYLSSLLSEEKSRKEISKWGLNDSIIRLKSEELKRLKSLFNNSSNKKNSTEKVKTNQLNDDNYDYNENNNDYYNNIKIAQKIGLFHFTRQTIYIFMITILSSNSAIKLINAYKNKINFITIFNNISILTNLDKLNLFFHEIYGFDKSLEFFVNFFSQFSNLLRKIFLAVGFDHHTFIPNFPIFSVLFSKVSSFLSSLSLFNSNFSSHTSSNNFSVSDLIRFDLTIQLQQLVFFSSVIAIPFLLYYRFILSLSTSVDSVENMLFLDNILQDSSFDSFFSSQNYNKNDFSDENSYKHENKNENNDKNRDENENNSYADDVGWTIDGPDKGSGVIFRNLSVERSGITVLNDMTLSFLPGTITIILTANTPSNPTQTRNSEILDLIYGTYIIKDINGKTTFNKNKDDKNKDDINYEQRGDILIHGRSQTEWHSSSLRDRILFMKDNDLEFNLPAGLLAGLTMQLDKRNPYTALENRILDITQTVSIFSSLPFGAGTVIDQEGGSGSGSGSSGGAGTRGGGYVLSSDQRRSLSLTRTLLSLSRTNKEIVLLEHPTATLSESQENKFFQFLRSEILVHPTQATSHYTTIPQGKVVIMTSNRFSTAVHADNIIVVANGRIVQEGTYKDLLSRPGPFQDNCSIRTD